MKRIVLEKHLRQHGCKQKRQGGNHTIWENPGNGKISPVPKKC